MDRRDSRRGSSGFGQSFGGANRSGEQAHFHEEELRNKAKAAKKKYEVALRFEFFGIPD